MVVALLQASHHGVTSDGAELIGEGAVEDQDVHGEDPLADGCGVLQDEALVDKENATWEKEDVKEKQSGTAELTVSLSRSTDLPKRANMETHTMLMCHYTYVATQREGVFEQVKTGLLVC